MTQKVWGGRHLTRDELESFLKDARIARFCSHNVNGTIHSAPVWFRYDNNKVVFLTPDLSRKAKNVKRDRDVSLIIDVEKPPRGVLIYGKAEFDSVSDLESVAIWICEKYMTKEEAKDQWRSAIPPITNWLKIAVKPEQIASFSFS